MVVAGLATPICILALAPAAGAATLAVDDDGADCPAAGFSSVQAAIDAAAPGDTVSVCPGSYVEGSGAQGTNALTIAKSIDLRGAGADLVSIKANPAGGGRIAAASPVIRDGVGNLLGVIGTPAAPLSVNVSGLTLNGNGVYPETGILFLDAGGSIVRSRVTRVVTSEAADANTQPGGYRSHDLGYGIAQVSAAAVAPPTPTRALLIDHTRIDKYNKVGILIDGATGDVPPLTPSGVDNDATLIANQVVGRTKCINFEANGNCSSPGNLTTGPLFGQDGVRITAGSQASMTDNTISQNLVSGSGAPAPGSATNNANLKLGSGIRLLGADATTLTHNNIVDNAYGVINLQLDGTSANTAVPVAAADNWWGLAPTGTANAGPAISPSNNPPTPENPVNGSATADPGGGTTSTAVDFFPFRDGPQSDPNSGEFPVVDAPIPVNDLAPTVSLTTDSPAYGRGAPVTLTADATDDFGVTEVRFYDITAGGTLIATDTSAPYNATLTVPPNAPCATRQVMALAFDFNRQTADDSATYEVVGPPDACAAPPNPPNPPLISVSFDDPPARIGPAGAVVKALPLADAGVDTVRFFLGAHRICTDSDAPYTCRMLPTGAQVGEQTLRAFATDTIGQSAQATRQVTVERFVPRLGVHLRRRRVVLGRLKLPDRVTAEQGCSSGSVTVSISSRHANLLAAFRTRIKRDCGYAIRVGRKALRGRPTVTARFGGNAVLVPVQRSRRFRFR